MNERKTVSYIMKFWRRPTVIYIVVPIFYTSPLLFCWTHLITSYLKPPVQPRAGMSDHITGNDKYGNDWLYLVEVKACKQYISRYRAYVHRIYVVIHHRS
jgi:hypothetical protein